MSVCHWDLHKRKRTGGRRRPYRKKRKYEMGSFPTETVLGPDKRKVDRRKGGNIKVRVFSTNKAVVSDPETGKSQLAEILRVVKNPANVDYDRRGVITKGCIIETSLGLAKVTSRPGQHGVVNAVLLKEQS